MKQKLVIWGAGGHALVVIDIVRSRNEYEILGLLDDVNPERYGTSVCGIPVLGGMEQLSDLHRMDVQHLLLGFGDCGARLRLSALVRLRGFRLITAVHPKAIIATGVSIGPGSVVAAGAVVNPAAQIGENVIINTCASIEHECVVEDGAHIAPGVRLGGGVRIGRASWIGIGAVIKERVSIGERSVIGAGAIVLDDIPGGVVAYGAPAKVIREAMSDE